MGTADPPSVRADDVVGVEDTSALVSTKQALLRIAVQLALGLAVMSAFTKLVRGGTDASVRAFPARMAREKPEVVILGNSIVRVLDEPTLSDGLGRRVGEYSVDGSMSAFWYVFTKNVVAAAREKPEAMILCFRDQHLTAPTYMLSGSSAFAALSLSHPDGEPLLDELALRPALGPVKHWAYEHWPLFRAREPLQAVTERKFLNKVLTPSLAADKQRLRNAYFGSIHNKHMDQELLNAMQAKATRLADTKSLDFHGVVERSFLPAILDHLERRGIRPVLVRMKTRRDAKGGGPPTSFEEYGRDLETYLQERGAIYLNYSDDERVRIEWFGVGDHFDDQGGREFSKVLARDLRPLLDAAR